MMLYFFGMVLLKLLVMAAIALAIYKLVVFIHGRYRSHIRGGMAVETLRKRFAAGEIDEEEYRTRLRVLRS
jgi:uncharacterized membrane protein